MRATRERSLFAGYLGSRNLKMTRERRVILDEIFGMQAHFDADDLAANLARRKAPVSRATVYRTLEHLVDSGFVQRIFLSDRTPRRALYERAHRKGHHEHMHCLSCGRIIEFTDDPLEKRQALVCQRLGFRPVSHALRIEGLCRGCQER